MIAIPDVNVLVALAWSNHQHHHLVHTWFARDSAAGWATCLLTQTGFLRLSLNPQVVGVSIDCPTALNLLRGTVAHPHHQFVGMLPALTNAAFDPLAAQIVGYRPIPDATRLCIANGAGMKRITLDQKISAIALGSQNLEVLIP